MHNIAQFIQSLLHLFRLTGLRHSQFVLVASIEIVYFGLQLYNTYVIDSVWSNMHTEKMESNQASTQHNVNTEFSITSELSVKRQSLWRTKDSTKIGSSGSSFPMRCCMSIQHKHRASSTESASFAYNLKTKSLRNKIYSKTMGTKIKMPTLFGIIRWHELYSRLIKN